MGVPGRPDAMGGFPDTVFHITGRKGPGPWLRPDKPGSDVHPGSPADVGHLYPLLARGTKLAGLGTAQLRVAIRALTPDVGHGGRELFIRAPAAHEGPQVMSAGREQAGEELALGGD